MKEKSYTQTSAILPYSYVPYNQVDNRQSRMVTSRGWRAEDSIAVLCDGPSMDKIKSMDKLQLGGRISGVQLFTGVTTEKQSVLHISKIREKKILKGFIINNEIL